MLTETSPQRRARAKKAGKRDSSAAKATGANANAAYDSQPADESPLTSAGADTGVYDATPYKIETSKATRDAEEDVAGRAAVVDAATSVVVGVEAAPVTMQRPVPSGLEAKGLAAPWLPRATRAPDVDHPYGTVTAEQSSGGDDTAPYYPNADMSVLQQHVAFFDCNGDGVITPLETYQSFRDLGFNILYSLLAVFFINLTFSYSTCESWIPDPLFRVNVRNIHRVKHGSDTGVYDTEGRFVPAKFEELFTKYAKTNPRYMTLREIFVMTESLRNAMDPYGWCAAKLEWGTLVLLVGERDPDSGNLVITKERMRAQYDGTLFYRIRDERKAATKPRASLMTATDDVETTPLPVNASMSKLPSNDTNNTASHKQRVAVDQFLAQGGGPTAGPGMSVAH